MVKVILFADNWFFFLRLLKQSPRISMTKNLVWALSNLCRGKNPPPDFSKVFYVMFPDAFLVKSIGSCLSIGMRQIVAFGIGM